MIKCLGQEAVRHNPAEPLLIGDALRCTSTLINAKENQAAPHRSAWDRRIMHGAVLLVRY